MREMRRKPEVQGKESQWEKISIAMQGLPQRNLHQFILWKVAPPECLFYKSESGCRFGEKCSYAHRQVDEQPSKRSEKDGDKSAVAMLKKHESYERTEKPVVYRDTSYERHGLVVCNSSNTRQLGCVFQDMEPPRSSSILRKN